MADAKKVTKGFGIKKETRGSSSPKFKLDPEVNGGLNLGILKEVTISTAEYQANQKGDFAAFAGKEVPVINFVFEGVPVKEGDAVPVYIHSFKPMPIVVGKYGWFYDSMFQTIKHFIDVYTNDGFIDAYEALLSLEIDPDSPMPFEDLHAAYTSFFNGVSTVFNGDGKELPCIFKDINGNPLLAWLKLLLYYNNNEVNRGNPGFSGYPGDGIIELYEENVTPSLRIVIERGESITPKVKGANKPAVPTSGGGGAQAGAQAGAAIPSFMKSKV